MYKKFKKYLFFHQYICQLLKNMRTRRSNLTASVLSISISISTSICTLVVPSLLSGTLVNCILKMNRSDNVCIQYNFKCDTVLYVLPAHWTVQTQLIPNPALHPLPVHLHRARLALASPAAAATGAGRDFSLGLEMTKVLSLEVKRQVALPG